MKKIISFLIIISLFSCLISCGLDDRSKVKVFVNDTETEAVTTEGASDVTTEGETVPQMDISRDLRYTGSFVFFENGYNRLHPVSFEIYANGAYFYDAENNPIYVEGVCGRPSSLGEGFLLIPARFDEGDAYLSSAKEQAMSIFEQMGVTETWEEILYDEEVFEKVGGIEINEDKYLPLLTEYPNTYSIYKLSVNEAGEIGFVSTAIEGENDYEIISAVLEDGTDHLRLTLNSKYDSSLTMVLTLEK